MCERRQVVAGRQDLVVEDVRRRKIGQRKEGEF